MGTYTSLVTATMMQVLRTSGQLCVRDKYHEPRTRRRFGGRVQDECRVTSWLLIILTLNPEPQTLSP